MVVKNQERWIATCLREATKICDKILIIDDKSTDRTSEIYKLFPKVEYRCYERDISRTTALRKLIRWAKKKNADWVLVLDAYEILEKGAADTIRRIIEKTDPREPVYLIYYMRLLHFWDDPEYFIINGSYSNNWAPRLFANWGMGSKLLAECNWASDYIVNHLHFSEEHKNNSKRINVCIKSYRLFDNLQKTEVLNSNNDIQLAKWTDRTDNQRQYFPVVESEITPNFIGEVVKVVPQNAATIFDVGCGRGDLGDILKQQDNRREVIGIEKDQIIGSIAMSKYDHVIVGDIEDISLNFPVGYFDCIVVQGILEKVINPLDVLLYLKKFLHDSGSIILKVSNARNVNIINKLINDVISCPTSKFSNQHSFRYFTLRDIKEMITSINMKIEEINYIPIKTHDMIDSIALRRIPPQQFKELHTRYFIIKIKH